MNEKKNKEPLSPEIYEELKQSINFNRRTIIALVIIIGILSGLLAGSWSNDAGSIISEKKTLNILSIGNSFNQDITAYLPPVLNELLPDYDISYGVCYVSGADIQTHIDMYNDNMNYTWFNYWPAGADKWTRYGGVNAKNLVDVLALEEWNIIIFQGTSSDVVDSSSVEMNIIKPSHELLNIIRNNTVSPFIPITIQWVARPQGAYTADEMYIKITEATKEVVSKVGFAGYIPIGTAIQSARTNNILKAIGDGGNMLYSDNTHLQAGLPALLATYTFAAYILKLCGRQCEGIYGSSFVPDDANCVAINARTEDKLAALTHGLSLGVTNDNIYAAQEIAYLAINNPDEISDTSDILE